MIEALFLATAMIVTDQEKANALETAQGQTIQSTAERCVGRSAVRFAQYTSENARDVAQYAARSCAAEIRAMSKSAGAYNLNFDALARDVELKIVQWRASAQEKGPDAFKQAASQYELLGRSSEGSSQ